jgi:DNA-binding GntR family transcriptional regulator
MEAILKVKSLTDQVHDYLSHSIIRGEIRPGERLIENDLSQRFGISRSPLRECFRILESDGLVVINSRKGVFVRDLTRKDIEDVFPVRIALECLAARLAIKIIDEKEIAILDDLIVQMETTLNNKNIREFLHLNSAFHSVFIKASHNQVLENTLKSLGKGFWFRIGFLFFQSPRGLDHSNQIHKEIVKAFRQRDAVLTEKLVEEHIQHVQEHLLTLL